MKKLAWLFIAVIPAMFIATVVMCAQGWQDDQDGDNFTLFDVATVSVNNLTAGGVVRSAVTTGTLQNGLVTYGDIQSVAADRLLGNPYP